jgi:hypothetical protein
MFNHENIKVLSIGKIFARKLKSCVEKQRFSKKKRKILSIKIHLARNRDFIRSRFSQ